MPPNITSQRQRAASASAVAEGFELPPELRGWTILFVPGDTDYSDYPAVSARLRSSSN